MINDDICKECFKIYKLEVKIEELKKDKMRLIENIHTLRTQVDKQFMEKCSGTIFYPNWDEL